MGSKTKVRIEQMKIVAIKDMSAGNEQVGEMWQETKIFDGEDNLIKVLQWGGDKKKITITLPDGEDYPEAELNF